MLSVNYLFDACALPGQLFFQPIRHRHHGRILFTQPLGELDYKRLRYPLALPKAFRNQRHER